MSSSFGNVFRVTTFGESHCKAVGVVVDGFPSGISVSERDIQPQLTRRRPGQNALSTPRDEKDLVTILSGVEKGITLGTPIAMTVNNRDQKPGDYSEMADIPRPSHGDYTYQAKYGIRAFSGGGRSSARETIGRVAAGALAEKLLSEKANIEIVAWVESIGEISAHSVDMHTVTREIVDKSGVRCPDSQAAAKMEALISALQQESDSTGGVIKCVCRNVPAGLGEPVFDKLEAQLAKAMLSIPATKGFEIGSGFGGSKMKGSVHNDPFVLKNGKIGTVTNLSGGIQGGISNGEPIYFKVAFKPPATIAMAQKTVDFKGNPVILAAKGRHDPCVVHRAVPIVESMAAIVLADLFLRQQRLNL
jgi:chorismate synthase